MKKFLCILIFLTACNHPLKSKIEFNESLKGMELKSKPISLEIITNNLIKNEAHIVLSKVKEDFYLTLTWTIFDKAPPLISQKESLMIYCENKPIAALDALKPGKILNFTIDPISYTEEIRYRIDPKLIHGLMRKCINFTIESKYMRVKAKFNSNVRLRSIKHFLRDSQSVALK